MPTARTIRFATFLAPSVFHVYSAITGYVGCGLGVPAELVAAAPVARGEIDAGFICGLPYVNLTRQHPAPVELLAAPVLQGERYGGRPIYFSDVIVRADSPYRSGRSKSWLKIKNPKSPAMLRIEEGTF